MKAPISPPDTGTAVMMDISVAVRIGPLALLVCENWISNAGIARIPPTTRESYPNVKVHKASDKAGTHISQSKNEWESHFGASARTCYDKTTIVAKMKEWPTMLF
jgi:hypothetical protein